MSESEQISEWWCMNCCVWALRVFTRPRALNLLFQAIVDSTNSRVWQKNCTAANTLPVRRPFAYLPTDGETDMLCLYYCTTFSRASNAEKSRKKITRKSLFQLKLFMKNNIPEEFPPLRLIMWSVISLTLMLSVCLVSRCSLAPSRCSSLIRTRGSISACCCASSWTTDRKWVLSRAGWSKSSPNPPRRDSPWRTLIVGLFHF